MTDVKISALTAYDTLAAGDYVPIVDISEAADADKTKRALLSTLNVFVPSMTAYSSSDYLATAKSTTAKTKLDLSALFSMPAGISAVLAYVYARDSGSAAGAPFVGLAPTTDASYPLYLSLAGVPNDTARTLNGIIPCTTDGDVYFDCAATGSETLDVSILFWGYWL